MIHISYMYVSIVSGNDCAAIVEYAPFQKVAKRNLSPKRKDPRTATILEDQEFADYLKLLEKPEPVQTRNTEKMLEDIEAEEREMKGNMCCNFS